MEKLTNNEMMNISGGQIESCKDWYDVLFWLEVNGHDAQARAVEAANFYGCIIE